MELREERHLFQIKYPTLGPDEEEIFYHHPTYDVKCNQLGIIYPGPTQTYFSYSVSADKYNLNDGKLKTSTPRLTLIKQCFKGVIESGVRSIPLDGNPFNTTYLNLVYPKTLNKLAKKNYNDFIERTVEYMLSRNKIIEKRGINPVMYWGLQRLHPAVKTLYANKTGTKIVLDSFGIPKTDDEVIKVTKKKTGPKKEYLPKEELNKRTLYCREQYAKGVSQPALAEEFGVSLAQIAYYIGRKIYQKD